MPVALPDSCARFAQTTATGRQVLLRARIPRAWPHCCEPQRWPGCRSRLPGSLKDEDLVPAAVPARTRDAYPQRVQHRM